MNVDLLAELAILVDPASPTRRKDQAYRELAKLVNVLIGRHVTRSTLASLGMEIDDLVMEVFKNLTAHVARYPDSLSKFANDRALIGFFRKIVINVIRSRLRNKNRWGDPEPGSEKPGDIGPSLPENLELAKATIARVFNEACHHNEVPSPHLTVVNRILGRWQEFFEFGAARVDMKTLHARSCVGSGQTYSAFERMFTRDRDTVLSTLMAYAELEQDSNIKGLAHDATELFKELAYIRED